jgi:hypothetical protein
VMPLHLKFTRKVVALLRVYVFVQNKETLAERSIGHQACATAISALRIKPLYTDSFLLP